MLGLDTETVMKIGGHSSVEVFLRYRTITAEKLDDAMSRLNTLITREAPASSQALEIATVWKGWCRSRDSNQS